MPLKATSIVECLNWNGCDIGTLLYLICLDGVDPLSAANWKNQFTDLGELVSAAAEALNSAEHPGNTDQIETDLPQAILRIGEAIAKNKLKKKRPRHEKPKLLVAS